MLRVPYFVKKNKQKKKQGPLDFSSTDVCALLPGTMGPDRK